MDDPGAGHGDDDSVSGARDDEISDPDLSNDSMGIANASTLDRTSLPFQDSSSQAPTGAKKRSRSRSTDAAAEPSSTVLRIAAVVDKLVTHQPTSQADSHDTFAIYIASELRQCQDPRVLMACKSKIFSAISEMQNAAVSQSQFLPQYNSEFLAQSQLESQSRFMTPSHYTEQSRTRTSQAPTWSHTMRLSTAAADLDTSSVLRSASDILFDGPSFNG